MFRVFISFCIAGLATSGAFAADGDAHGDLVAPFLQQHCAKCHNGKKQSGDFRLDDISAEPGKDGERWQSTADADGGHSL